LINHDALKAKGFAGKRQENLAGKPMIVIIFKKHKDDT
jgi:hypothetical protein